MADPVLKMLPHGGGGWNTRRMEHEGSSLFAVIETGGKQYSVAAGDTITVMALAGNPGDRVTFDRVLMLSQDGEPALGTPFVDGASVGGQIVGQTRGSKAIAFKKRRRKNSKRKRGHRQDLTLVRITGFLTDGVESSVGTAPSE
jgi:large subunit ribosomal protein L21